MGHIIPEVFHACELVGGEAVPLASCLPVHGIHRAHVGLLHVPQSHLLTGPGGGRYRLLSYIEGAYYYIDLYVIIYIFSISFIYTGKLQFGQWPIFVVPQLYPSYNISKFYHSFVYLLWFMFMSRYTIKGKLGSSVGQPGILTGETRLSHTHPPGLCWT